MVTVTGTVLKPDGVVAVIVVELTTCTPRADLPPNVTVAPEVNPVPVMVTDVPPSVLPVEGTTPLT